MAAAPYIIGLVAAALGWQINTIVLEMRASDVVSYRLTPNELTLENISLAGAPIELDVRTTCTDPTRVCFKRMSANNFHRIKHYGNIYVDERIASNASNLRGPVILPVNGEIGLEFNRYADDRTKASPLYSGASISCIYPRRREIALEL